MNAFFDWQSHLSWSQAFLLLLIVVYAVVSTSVLFKLRSTGRRMRRRR